MEPPKAAISKNAKVKSLEEYQRLYHESLEQPEKFWAQQAERLTWYHQPDTIYDFDFDAVDVSWFAGGKLNAAYNCIDRHLATRGDKTAIIWAKDEPGEYEHISYTDLKHEVCRVANVLKAHGVKRGDRVCIYLPMIPELAYTMLACARIGAVHSIVFAGFSADSLRDRIEDAHCKVLVTANEGRRGGRSIPLKQTSDKACEGSDVVETILVVKRADTEVDMKEGRDHWMHEETAKQRSTCPAEWMDAEEPLYILYTSGSTGKPKGLMHTTGGYMVYASMTHEYVFDLREDDVYCCAADIGWVTGHSYIIYGPLANGATTVMFESTPVYPDASRYWQLVDDLKINIFYTAPTAIRALIAKGDEFVEKTKRDSLRILGSVGEPINPEVWEWYHDLVGKKQCSVVDTWWQTETGGILITPLPGATPCKPGSATFPFFGIEPCLVDDEGKEIEGNDVRGNLCIKRSWPGQARTIYGDHARYKETYFSQYPGMYFTGDGCRRDEDGYYWITGRVDDVLNVSGHRIGTAEVESALVEHHVVAEAAVVGCPHDIKGTGIYAYCYLSPEATPGKELEDSLANKVREIIGPFAKPDHIQFVPGLPKTRSGKIMRRILRKIAAGEYHELGDVTTLADPAVVEKIVEGHKAIKG